MRGLLAGLIIAATIGFAIGTTIERNQKDHHGEGGHHEGASESKATTSEQAAPKPHRRKPKAKPKAVVPAHDESGESAAHIEAEHAQETGHSEESKHTTKPARKETRSEHKEEVGGAGETEEPGHSEASEAQSEELFGVNPESVPLMIAAITVSLALALAVWLRPRSLWLLVVVALVMVAAAALDLREVAHQLDEDRTGLAITAGLVAVLHLAAATVAAMMALATRSNPPSRRDTMTV